jgi:Flp pilus assembly protein TadD
MTPETDSPELRGVVQGEPLGRVVPLSQNDFTAISTAGYAFLEQGQWEESRNAFDALIQLCPKLPEGYAGRGAVAIKERKFTEAVEILSRALKACALDARVCALLGEAILRLGQAKEAAELFRSAAQLDPEKQNPVVNRARAMLAAIEEREQQPAAAGTPK